jgi:hypothetical protein
MNFILGVLVMAIAILALKTVMKAAAGLCCWAGRLIRICRKHRTMRYRSTPVRIEQRTFHPMPSDADWQAISRELRREILGRGVRVSSQTRKLCQLDEAIEIQKREIELARLNPTFAIRMFSRANPLICL